MISTADFFVLFHKSVTAYVDEQRLSRLKAKAGNGWLDETDMSKLRGAV